MKVYDLIYIILISFIVGCSGIRGSGGTPDEEPIVTPSNKVLKGKVSQVDIETNEITINGVQVSLTGATIYRNSSLISSDAIRAGQIVSVEASTSKKGKFAASKIEIEDQIQGPIKAIDLEANTITVLGQEVHITSSTSFTQKSFKTLKVNYYIAVFGFRNDSGVLEATLIELLQEYFQASKDTVKIAGEVASVDVAGGNIIVEGIEIQLNNEEIKDIKVGDVLSLDGLAVSAIEPNLLTASATEAVIQSDVKDYDLDREVVLEGLPQKITDRNRFSLNGYQVIVPIELMDADNILSVENRKLIVSGKFIGEKEVLASSLRLEQIKDFEFRGLLKSTSQENIVSIFDKEIEINIFTFVDFNLKEILTEINEGLSSKTVYAKGYVDSSGKRIATSVSLNLDDHEQFEFIKGKIESIDNGTLFVCGVPFKLNGVVTYYNEDRPINNVDLLALLSVGDRVEIYGGFGEDKVFITYFLGKNLSLTAEGEKSIIERLMNIKVR